MKRIGSPLDALNATLKYIEITHTCAVKFFSFLISHVNSVCLAGTRKVVVNLPDHGAVFPISSR